MNNDLPPALIPVRKETGIKESTLFGLILDAEHAYASLARVMAAESVLMRTRKLL